MTLFGNMPSRIFKDAKCLQTLSEPLNGKPLCRGDDLELMADFLSKIFRTGQGRNLIEIHL